MTTKTIKKFDKPTCKLVRADIDAAMAAVAAKYGIKLQSGRGTFGDTNFTLKLEMSVLDETGVDLKAKREFETLANFVGLEPGDFGRQFTFRGEQYELSGINHRSTKMPILAKNVATGAKFKFGEDTVLRALGRHKPAEPKTTTT